MKKTNRKPLSLTFWVVFALILGTADYIRQIVTGKQCLFKALFGIACPACGMSRAFYSLMKLNLRMAFYYHPMFWAFPLCLGFTVLTVVEKRHRRLWATAFALLAVAFLGCRVIRLATGTAV